MNAIAPHFTSRCVSRLWHSTWARRAQRPTEQNRVVTVDGQLIESSGAMTGGGRGPRHRIPSKQSGVAAAVASPTNGADPQELAQQLRAAVKNLHAQNARQPQI
jgi:chromosome segregation ATPase